MGKGRYVVDLPTPLAPEQVWMLAQQFAATEGFRFTNYKGEDVLQKGDGWVTAPQFIKLTVYPGVVRLEAWLKFAWWPGVYGKDMDLEGFYGIAMKKVLRSRVDHLAASIQQRPVAYY